MDVRRVLREHGLRPQKKLGQNFLVDQESVELVLKAADIKSTDKVVEVGAGPGILTPGLCNLAKKVIAVELDRAMVPALKSVTQDCSNLEIRQADILRIDPAEFP